MTQLVQAGTTGELAQTGHLIVESERGELCVVFDGEHYFALDNNCPHMGSQIHRGTIVNGKIICPWHRARFDLKSGKSLDLYAADISAYDVVIEGDVIFVNPTPR
jgi:nitrite reductase/ring-hydroxylating ferredoxin subunit